MNKASEHFTFTKDNRSESWVQILILSLRTYLRALVFIPYYWWRNAAMKLAAWHWFSSSSMFRSVITQFSLRYLFVSPFTICREYFRHEKEDGVQTIYGETPLKTFKTIAQLADIKPGDLVYELGCGRGIGVFWLRLFTQCRCVGVELNPVFVRKAEEVRRSIELSGVDFVKANFIDFEMPDADVIYLYGTALDDATIKKLAKHFKHLPSGTRIVTVSYPLSDYADGYDFALQAECEASFLWGDTTLYLQVRV